MREGLAAGKLSILLRGRKLKGSWTLVKTTRGDKDWLLIKHKDRFVDTRARRHWTTTAPSSPA